MKLTLAAAIFVLSTASARKTKITKFAKSSKSSGGRSPIEEQLDLTFLTPAQIATEFDETKRLFVSDVGLIGYRATGLTPIIEMYASEYSDITFDEFKQACATKCHKNLNCKAAVSSKVSDSTKDEALGMLPRYHCDLVDPDLKINGVPAIQLTVLPDAPNATKPYCECDETRTLFVKKGHAIQPFDGCKVNYPQLETSIGCLACQPYNLADTKDYCPSVRETCVALLGAPDNSPQPDFWTKVVPAIQCLGSRVETCLPCVTSLLASLKESAGRVCTKNEVYSAIRGSCRAQCYDGVEQCEGFIQTSLLCATGSAPLQATGKSLVGGAINTPYVCPPEE